MSDLPVDQDLINTNVHMSGDSPLAVKSPSDPPPPLPNIIQVQEEVKQAASIVDQVKALAAQVIAEPQPIGALHQLNLLLRYDKPRIWEALASSRPEKLEFYKTVFKAVTDKLLGEKAISEHQYLLQILVFFRNILVEYFASEDIEEEALAEVVHTFFNLDAHLYTVAMQSPGSAASALGVLRETTYLKVLNDHLIAGSLSSSQQQQINGQENYLNQVFTPIQLSGELVDILSNEQKRVIGELPWRMTLKEGDRIDAIVKQNVQLTKIGHWARATIVHLVEQSPSAQDSDQQDSSPPDPSRFARRFRVHFDGLDNSFNRYFDSISFEVAAPGTYTQAFDWRQNLNQGDMIDCIDNEAIWYRSTVLDVKETAVVDEDLPQAQSIKEVYVAYRYYSEEEGHKVDEELGGKRYVGWSNKYDAWIPVNSPQIQRIRTISRFYKVAGRTPMQYDGGVSDDADIMHNTEGFAQWVVHRDQSAFAKLKFFPDFINDFGAQGGFKKLLKLLRGELTETPMTVKHLWHVTDFLAKVHPLFTRQFMTYYIPLFKDAFLRAIMGGPLKVNFNKDHLTGAQANFSKLLKRYYPCQASGSHVRTLDDNYYLIEADMIFCVAITLLKSEKLEQRVAGLNQINSVIRPTTTYYYNQPQRGLDKSEMVKRLRDMNVMEIIFGDKDSHIQLVMRGLELVKFLVQQREFSQQYLELVWAAAHRGEEQTKLEIYNIFRDVSGQLSITELESIIRLFSGIEPEKFILREIECLSSLISFGNRPTQAVQLQTQLFFDIAVQNRPYPKELVEVAIDKLIGTVRTAQENALRLGYIQRAYDTLVEHRASIQCIRIIAKILEEVPSHRYSDNRTRYEVASELIDQYKILDLVIVDLQHYSEAVNQLWDRGELKRETIDTTELFRLPFTHRSNIANRLAFIRQLLCTSLQDLQGAQLEQIWDILVTNSKVTTDQQYFFEWLQGLISERTRVSFEIIQSLFETKVCQRTEPGFFSNIMKSGFECVQTMFLQVNEHEELLHITSQYSNVSNQVTKLDFIVLTPPHKLIGIEVIWKILQECDKKNFDLTASVVDLLTKLYNNLGQQIGDDEVRKIHDSFCHECLSQMKVAAANQATSEDEKKQFIRSVVDMIKTFLYEAEKHGMGQLRSHLAINRGEYLERVILQNMVSQVKTYPRLIEVNTYSNMTVWELKKLAAIKFQVSPLQIQLQRHDSKKTLPQFNDIYHHRLLKHMKLESNEIIQVQRKAFVSAARVKLLNKKGELIPEARAIFQSWFRRFSDQEGYMTPKECSDFIKATTNTIEPVINPTDSRISNFFKDYSLAVYGKLTEEEFLRFYTDKAQSKLEVVWNNLSIMKYGGDLRHISEVNNPDDPRELKSFEDLPRAKLSSNQELFRELIALLATLPPSSQEEVSGLLSLLRTNPLIYSDLLALKSVDSLSLRASTTYEVLYKLQILDSLVNEYQTKQPSEVKAYFSEPLVGAAASNDQSIAAAAYPALSDAYNTPVVAEASVAIPLPPASSIPEPPAPKVPFIGPMAPPGHSSNNNGSTSASVSAEQQVKKVNDLLATLKNGHVEVSSLRDNLFEDEELAKILGCEQIAQLRASWAERFVSLGGLKRLLYILKDIQETFQTRRGTAEYMKVKAERECLKLVLNILKTLLMSAFITNMPSPELSLALSQRMNSTTPNQESSNNEDGKDAQKKASVLEEQETTTKLYGPLIEIMTGATGERLLEDLDFRDLQNDLFKILEVIMTKKEFVYDDRAIMESATNLWISAIVFNQELLQVIFDQWNSSQQQQQVVATGSTQYTKILIHNGLLSNQAGFRSIVLSQVKFLAQSVRSPALSERPYIFFLRVLLTNSGIAQTKPRESAQYHQLLLYLLQLYMKHEREEGFGAPLFDHSTLLRDYIGKLREYRSHEEKGRSFYEDFNIGGIMRVVQEMIQNDPQIMTVEDAQALAEEVLAKYLFTFDIKPIAQDITKHVDLVAWEKPQINRCHSVNSRKAAFSLLHTLCTTHPQLIPQVITGYYSILLGQVRKPKKAGYQPKLDVRNNSFVGLRNLGSICYMNSMLQQFYAIPAFRYSILSIRDQSAPNLVDFEGDQINDNMLHQLMKLMAFLELSERSDYNPREFCFSYKDFNGGPTNVREQKDTQEFLNIAFDRVENALRDTPQKYLLQNVFGGKTCSVTICKGCGNVNMSSEQFFNLSLEVQNQNSIHDGLKRLVTGETVNDYQCNACRQRVDIEKKTVVEVLPNTLILHLQRIIFDMDTFMNRKLNTRVEFPQVLNMRGYMKDEVLKADKERIEKAKRAQRLQQRQESEQKVKARQTEDGKEGEDVPMVSDEPLPPFEEEVEQMTEADHEMPPLLADEDFEYKLVGVVLHMGTADAGHYLSYINTNRSGNNSDQPEWLLTEKDKWLEFNDSLVRDYRFANIEQDCFGGVAIQGATGPQDEIVDYSRNAYMLYYEKRKKEPIKIVVPKALVQSATGQTILAESLIPVCPHLSLDKLKAKTLDYSFDPETSEYVTKSVVDFSDIEKYVPNDLYKLVHRDNHQFLFERQLYNAGFYESIKGLLQTLLEADPDYFSLENQDANQGMFDFMSRLTFDVLSMTTENKQLIDIVKLFMGMLQRNPYQTFQVIEKRVLMLEREPKEQREFFETLVSHLDRDVREMHAIVLLKCTNMCFQEGNTTLVDLIMQNVFSLIPEDLAKNWLKCEHLLWFLLELAKSGRAQLVYLMKHCLVSKLIDFYLENESPLVVGPVSVKKKRAVMGSNYAQPPLGNLILCISYIVRQQDFVNLQGKARPQLAYNGQKLQSMYCFNHSGEEIMDLHTDDLYMLSQKPFLQRGLKGNYELVEFVRLICHICYGNFTYSRMVAKVVLIGLNKASADETFSYISLVAHMLTIPDQYMSHRMEWLLGIPCLRIEYPKNFETNQTAPLKVGIQILKSPDDEMVEYKSTLYKTPSGIKDSYLRLLYQYRKRWAKYVLDALIALLQSCLNDQSNLLYYYLYTLEGPTPQYARYMDWLKPFLLDTIQQAIRNPSLPDSPQEIQLSIQASQLFDQLITTRAYSGELINQNTALSQLAQEQSADPLRKLKRRSYKYDIEKDYGAQQYLIWNILKEVSSDQQWIEVEEGFISVVVKEYEVSITDSQPDGQTNQVFPPQLFPNYRPPYQNYGWAGNRGQLSVSGYANGDSGATTGTSTLGWGKNRAYGRGSQPSYQVSQARGGVTVQTANRRHQPISKKNKVRPAPLYTRKPEEDEETHPNQDIDDGFLTDNGEFDSGIKEENFMDVENTQAPQDDSDLVPHINSPADLGLLDQTDSATSQQEASGPTFAQQQPAVDGAAAGEREGPAAATAAPPDEMAFDGENSHMGQDAGGAQSQSVEYIGGASQVHPQDEPRNNQQKQDEDEPMIEEEVKGEEDNDSWSASSTIRVYSVQNESNRPQKVNLQLYYGPPESSQQIQQQAKPNERIPVSHIPGLISPGNNLDFYVLTKLRPFDDWGNVKWSVIVGDLPKDREPPVPLINQPVAALSGATTVPVRQPSPEPEPDALSCSACTFDNPLSATICEVCGNNLK